MTADILIRKQTAFVLWSPQAATAPGLILGQFKAGNPPQFLEQQRLALVPVAGIPGLWELPAVSANLQEGEIYHFWFLVDDTRSVSQPLPRIPCADPLAFSVDWRISPADAPDNTQPAAVVRFHQGRLEPCDPGGETGSFAGEPTQDTLPANNRMVLYELPTAWTKTKDPEQVERGVGTFRDVAALVAPDTEGANFASLNVLRPGYSYLADLGVNALELLPPADSFFKREWGYDTSHFLAPDFELGFPEDHASPTANRDLALLVRTCHQHGIRFFVDMVMAFAKEEAYQRIDRNDFYIADPRNHPDDPDAKTSVRANGNKDFRDGFGSVLFRYATFLTTYDPLSGQPRLLAPARQLMFTALVRWMQDFHIDGIRLDSVENVANWDFIGEFKNQARQLWRQRWNDAGLGGGAEERFLVVGEELTLPLDLLGQQRLDGLWNDAFRACVRAAILGQNVEGEPSFEWTVRKAIDCRNLGFTDGAQAINYVTSHDVEGFRRERLFTMLRGFADEEKEKRIKLAFVCLLTSVGIPMILAGEEFGDQHDRFDEHGNVTQDGGKQVDPVNFSRQEEPLRRRIFDCVARLVKLRTGHPALAVNETEFLHRDFNDGKRVLVWRRGLPGTDPVIVVANFSDFTTENAGSPLAEYRVPNWPATPAGRQWREVTQARPVPEEWIGREPIYAWEAKVYTLA
jgi:pullulanase